MISTIVVTYNSMNVLADCFSSLEQCTVASEIELILVDNASTDGTSQLLQEYLARAGDLPYAGIRVLTLTDNHGYAYANNRGLEMARGETLLLLNPDTIVGGNTIQKCVDVLRHNIQIGAVGCRLQLANGKLDLACKRSFPTLWNSVARFSGLSLLFPSSSWLARYNLTFLDEAKSYFVDSLSGAFMMVPRSAYESVGGLDEVFFMYGEDIDWCYRIKRARYDVWYEGSVSTLHLKGGSGGKRSRSSLRHFYHAMYLYYIKTRGYDETEILAKIALAVALLMFRVHVLVRQVQ